MLMPRKMPYNPAGDPNNMRSNAARMAAEEDEVAPAPVIPTTNMRMQPKGMSKPAAALQAFLQAAPVQSTAGPTAASARPPAMTGDPHTSPTPPDPEQLRAAAQNDLLNNNPHTDTTQEEALIRELLGQKVGQGQRELNARMGAAGFGTSGALGAATENMRSDAARAAAQDILGEQHNAENRWRQNVTAGIGAQDSDRGLSMQEQKYQNELALAQEAQHPNWHDTNNDGKDDVNGQTLEEYQSGAAFGQKLGLEGNHEYNDMGLFSMFDAGGSENKPFSVGQENEAQMQSRGWRMKQGFGGARKYQDPNTGTWYVVVPR